MSDSEYPDNRVLFGVEKLVNKYKIKPEPAKIEEIKEEGESENENNYDEYKQEEALKSSIQNLINNTTSFDFDKLSSKLETQSTTSRKSQNWSIGSHKSNNSNEKSNHTEPPLKQYYEESKKYNEEETQSVKEKEFIKPKGVSYNEKVKLLREWERIAKRNQKYTLEQFDINSDYNEIKDAITRIKYAKSRENWNDRMQSGVLIATNGIENFVHKYNIFGYGESIIGLSINMKRELHTFDDIFDDLYDKWATSGRDQPPEIRLIFNFLKIIILYMISQVATNLFNKHIDKEFKKNNSKREMSPPEHDDETLELLEKYKT